MKKLIILNFSILALLLQGCNFYSMPRRPSIPLPILERYKPANMAIVNIKDSITLQKGSVYYLKMDGNYSIQQLEGILANHPEIEYIHIQLYITKDLNNVFQQLAKLKKLKYMEITLANSVPPSIGLLRSLKCLIINESEITTLPAEIGELDSLETLCLGFLKKHGQMRNQIRDLPIEMTNLRQLRYLYLSANAFQHVPELVCKFPKLEYLALSSNSISTLPACLCQQNVAIDAFATKINHKKLKNKCLKRKLIKEVEMKAPKL